MKPVSWAGIVLIALGVMALVYQGITYTTRETVIDLGPLKAEVEKQKTIPSRRSSACWQSPPASS